LSQLGIGGASALGAGQVGAANAYANVAGGLGSNLMLSQFLTPQGGGLPGGAIPTGPAGDYFRPNIG
jgi:hypothetical protein